MSINSKVCGVSAKGWGIVKTDRGDYTVKAQALIKQYLSSFSTSDMRIKIYSANTLIEGLVGSILSFIGAFL